MAVDADSLIEDYKKEVIKSLNEEEDKKGITTLLKLKSDRHFKKCEQEANYKNADSNFSCAKIASDFPNELIPEYSLALSFPRITKRDFKSLKLIQEKLEAAYANNPKLGEKLKNSLMGLEEEFAKINMLAVIDVLPKISDIECIQKKKPFIICLINNTHKLYSSKVVHLAELKKDALEKSIKNLKLSLKDEDIICSYDPQPHKELDSLFHDVKNIERKIMNDFTKEEHEALANDTDKLFMMQPGPYLKTNIFQIQISNWSGSQKKICSATQVKIQGKCHLVTNQHCINDFKDPKIKLFPGLENDPRALLPKSYDIQIERSDENKELVLFKAHDKINKLFCSKIVETKILSATEMIGEHDAIITAGYLKSGQVDLQYNFDAADEDTKFVGRAIKTGLPGIKDLVEFKYIDVGPGMSGGALLNQSGNVLGITTRYVPHQDTPIVIPMSEVQDFIQNKPLILVKDKKLYNLKDNYLATKRFSIGDNVPGMPGDNVPNMPGDNVPGMPGDNVPNMPGSNLLSGLFGKSSSVKLGVNSFMEKHEGIIDFNDPQKRKLLAVQCSDKSSFEQIDGHDDYLYKCDDVTALSENQKVYLDKEGFVPKEYRKDILKNLQGDFMFTGKNSGRKTTFKENPKSIDSMEKESSKLHKDSISIKENEITLRLADNIKMRFTVSSEEEGRFIYLKPEIGGAPLKCENRSMLKLICENGDYALTLSLVNSKNKSLTYKFARRVSDKRYEYSFGDY